ncbi:MAG: hypothetical protein ABSC19_13645 [Syntrophorhabdales bacterium]|jgi:hypothetical protein
MPPQCLSAFGTGVSALTLHGEGLSLWGRAKTYGYLRFFTSLFEEARGDGEVEVDA